MNSERTGKFLKSQRLRKRRQFEELQQNAEKVYTRHFLLAVRRTELSVSRIGITVTKKVSVRAVDRNRIKRRIREFFRKYRHLLNASFDIVVIARRDAHLCSMEEITRTLLGALKKNGLIDAT